jgi:hypothetical protein
LIKTILNLLNSNCFTNKILTDGEEHSDPKERTNTMYNPKSLKAEEFISHEEVLETLEYAEENKNNL